MNRRFQNEEINIVHNLYSENELYRSMEKIGPQFEYELKQFGLCPEECFMETHELLSLIADKGEDVMDELNNYWFRKITEYRRFDRQVDDEEIYKAIGIIFGFAILALDSSHHSFYRTQLTRRLIELIVEHPFKGNKETLGKIFEEDIPDGWFDNFLEQDDASVADMMATIGEQTADLRKQYPNTTPTIVINQYNDSCLQTMGEMINPQFKINK